MCGIVGGFALGKVAERQEKLRQESLIFLTTELLQLTQARGTDATGVSTLFNDGNFIGLKMGISSPEFISRFGGTKEDFEGFIKLWRENEQTVKTYLGHCRKTSIGSAKDNFNNHPIKVGNIVGIHNGTLTNHDVIFEKLDCKRDGDVDSEAIIRLLHFYTKKGTDPFTIEMLKEVCLRLQGTYSVIAYNADNPNQIVTFRDGKPNVAALIRPLNILLMASEESYIKQVLYRYNKHSKIYLPKIKFPILKKDDIDFQTMPDDTCAVFNLADKVEKDTKVNDLFESERVPRLDKIWKKGTTYNKKNTHNTHNINANANANKSAAGNTADVDKGTIHGPASGNKAKTVKVEKEIKGKVWNKDLKEFKEIDDDEEERAKKIKSIEIDSAGKVDHLEISDDEDERIEVKILTPEEGDCSFDDVNLKETSKEEVNKLVGNVAKVKDEPVVVPAGEVIDVINPSTGKVQSAEKSEGTTIEVDTNVNVAALEAATRAAAMQPKFENDDEVLEELGVDDKKKLESLQLFAFANRVSKVLFKKSFYKGYVEAEQDGKLTRAENSIKTLKVMTKIFIKALRATSHNDGWKKEHIEKASGTEKEITVDDIHKVFSVGDIRDNPELKHLKDSCSK